MVANFSLIHELRDKSDPVFNPREVANSKATQISRQLLHTLTYVHKFRYTVVSRSILVDLRFPPSPSLVFYLTI